MVERDDFKNDDNIQHGIDDSPRGDAEKGAALGGLGGAVTGGIAGSAIGPVGTVVGAVVGGVVGAAASGVAVAAVDKVDNDNNMTGVGSGVQTDVENKFDMDRTNDYDSSRGSDIENRTNMASSGISTDYAATNWEATRSVNDDNNVFQPNNVDMAVDHSGTAGTGMSNYSGMGQTGSTNMGMGQTGSDATIGTDSSSMTDETRGVSMHSDYTKDMANNISDMETRSNQEFPNDMAESEDYASKNNEYGNNTPNYSMGMGGEAQQPGTGFGQRNAAMGNDMGVTGAFGTNSNDLTTGQASTSNDLDVANNIGETQAGMTNYGNATGTTNDLDSDNWNNENNTTDETNRKF